MSRIPIVSRTLLFIVGAAALGGCSQAPENGRPGALSAAVLAPYCEGLDPDNCLLPWPSSRFLVADATTATGHRVALPPAAMPANVLGTAVDPAPWNRWDGFSPMTSAMAELPLRIDPTPLVDFRHVEDSLDRGSPTVLLDATLGRRVAHWAEIEVAPDADPTRTTLYVRPAARLAEDHRYIVAIRTLRAQDGRSTWQGSAAFRALRDGTPSGDPAIEARRRHFDEQIFEPLARAGVKRQELSLAWDFATGSGPSAWGDLVAMARDADRAAGDDGIACKVATVIEDPRDPHVFRRIEGTLSVPVYLDALDGTGRIVRDRRGQPVRAGQTQIPFLSIIPRSAAASRQPTRLINFGHGLLTSRYEAGSDPFFIEQIDRDRMIVAAVDLTGLADGDQQLVGSAFFDLNAFPYLVDRVAQSLIGQLLAPRTLAGKCSALPAFRKDGRALIDPDRRYYIGESQGGDFAATLAALSGDMDRFVAGVGAIDYSVITMRSTDFSQGGQNSLFAVYAFGYPRRVDRDLLMVMSQHEWERIEGSAFAPHVLDDRLMPGHPHLLLPIGLYDVGTGNEGSYIMARTLGLSQARFDAAPIWGFPRYALTARDAMVTYDYGVPPVPPATFISPQQDNCVHQLVRRDLKAQAQMDAFLRPGGVVVDVCGGACRDVPPHCPY